MNPAALCPLCGLNDRTQPVPALIAQHTTHTTTSGTAHGIAFAGDPIPFAARHHAAHTSQTPLARTLSLPAPLKPPDGGVAVAGLVLCGLTFLLAAILFLAVLPLGRALPGLVFPAVPCGGIALMCWLSLQGRRAGYLRWDEQRQRWQAAVPVWQALRYCHRDGVVYHPAGPYMNPEAATQFCYETATPQPRRLP